MVPGMPVLEDKVMQPVSPVLTEEFVPIEIVYAANQPEWPPEWSLRNG